MIDSLMRLGLKNIGSRFTLTYLSGFLKFSTSFCDIDHYHILSKSSEKKDKNWNFNPQLQDFISR